MAPEDDVSDSEILERIAGGDTNAFEELVSRYQAYVLSIVAKRVPRTHVREVGHEVFISAFQSLDKYRGDSPFRFWLRSIVTRRCYDYWRKSYRKHEISSSSLSNEHEDIIEAFQTGEATKVFETNQSQRAAREILEHVLAQMSAEDKVIITLIDLEGYSIKGAAKELGWGTSKTKIRVFRARRHFRELAKGLLENSK